MEFRWIVFWVRSRNGSVERFPIAAFRFYDHACNFVHAPPPNVLCEGSYWDSMTIQELSPEMLRKEASS